MKLKFMLVPLAVLGLAVGSYADCSKDEILKLIDKGFSKTEIDGICGKSESKEKELTWVIPNANDCRSNNGTVYSDGCRVNSEDAFKTCNAIGGRIATSSEFNKMITDNCTTDKNTYESCYKSKGFSTDWSYLVKNKNRIELIGLKKCSIKVDTKKYYIRCIKDVQ